MDSTAPVAEAPVRPSRRPAPSGYPLHILVLSDRDWTHPQGGGTGVNLYGQVSRWLSWGHRVSVISCAYPGCIPREQRDGLTLLRVGGRSTVFLQAIWRQAFGLVPDADVVLEVINGITFLTPLWLRVPRVALVHHPHRRHYREEMGPKGALAAFLLETAPLRTLYGSTRFIAVSQAAARELEDYGIAPEMIEVNYNGVEVGEYSPGPRAERPTLVYLGRIKRYKHLESLLDVLDAVPGAVLDVAGDGDHRPAFERAVWSRGLAPRVRIHGYVDEATKVSLLQRAWVNVTASSCEGWGLSVMEAAACGTPSTALAVGGLPEAIVDGETGLLATSVAELGERTRAIIEDPALRERLGEAALWRAREFSWDHTAETTLAILEGERARRASRQPALTAASRASGLAATVMAGNVVALSQIPVAIPAPDARPRGVRRVRTLWGLWRREKADPVPFYRMLAGEAVEDLEARNGPLAGQTIVDLGCGPGLYTEALRQAGAEVIPVDNDPAELELAGPPPKGALLADAGDLPLDNASVDGVFCSNLLEHTPDAAPVIAEIERILRPGGWAYVSWTNWYSPWGGHDMTPYQYLGPRLGPRLYERVHGPPRKNGLGDGLWPVHIGPTLRLVARRPGLRVDRVEPRYWPSLAFICRIPGVRELLTWNCVIRVTRD